MPRKESTTGPVSAQAQQDQVSDGIENFELPRSLVTRIAKAGIPESTKLQKEVVLALVKGSTVFINYLAATAHDVAHSKQHKSISASDVLKALEIVEFGDLVEGLQAELQVFRENAKADKSRKGASSASASASVAKKGKSKAKEKEKVQGKEKEKALSKTDIPGAGPPPLLDAPQPHPLSSVSAPGDAEDEIDEERVEGGEEVPDEDVMEGMEYDEGDVVDEEDFDDDVGDADEGEAEEPLDMMAVEEEEIRADGRALENGDPSMHTDE